MKHELAFNLIGKQLDWSDASFASEFKELQLMIDHKYDSYQGFQPATRFHVALLNWLSQLPQLDQRQTAYRFVKDRLIFISQREMYHLVSLLMPILAREETHWVAEELGVPRFRVETEPKANRRRDLLRRRTLYVGLSDGARIDVFRRFNEGRVSNEQVVAFSEISTEKWDELLKELRKNLDASGHAGEKAQYERVCLVDDFSGSGSSLLRFDASEEKWKGKIAKFHKANVGKLGNQLAPNCRLHIHHYLASTQAKSQIYKDLVAFAIVSPQFRYEATYSYVLPPDIVVDNSCGDANLVTLLTSWYDKGIEDEHTKEDIWFGYKQCGLPLVLEHNSPNNSVALLWATSENGAVPQMKPLFARRKRHSSNG